MAENPLYFLSILASNAVNGGGNLASSFYLNENKGKQSLHLQDGSSLSLGLCCSVSSDITMFSGKEIEEHSSSNGLSLELSLATGSVESGVTPTSFPFEYNGKQPRVTSSTMTCAGFPLVDEGLTSSRWKFPLLPPLQMTDATTPMHNIHNGLNSVIHVGLSSFGSGL